MNQHDTVVPPSRRDIVLPQSSPCLLKTEESGVTWYVDDGPHLWSFLTLPLLTGKMGENGQYSMRR